jgi:hypothetical protein
VTDEGQFQTSQDDLDTQQTAMRRGQNPLELEVARNRENLLRRLGVTLPRSFGARSTVAIPTPVISAISCKRIFWEGSRRLRVRIEDGDTPWP